MVCACIGVAGRGIAAIYIFCCNIDAVAFDTSFVLLSPRCSSAAVQSAADCTYAQSGKVPGRLAVLRKAAVGAALHFASASALDIDAVDLDIAAFGITANGILVHDAPTINIHLVAAGSAVVGPAAVAILHDAARIDCKPATRGI